MTPPPLRVAAAVVVLGTAFLRRRASAQQRREAQQRPSASEWVTAAVAPRLQAQSAGGKNTGSQAAAPPTKSAQRLAAAVLGAVSTAVVASVVALLVQRGAHDIAALALLAWLLHMLQILLLPKPLVNGAHGAKAAPAMVVERIPLPPIAGTWVKDHSASDSMDEVMDAMRMNGLLRSAIRLLRGVEIKLDEKSFQFAVFSVVRWFKIAESYQMDGSVGSNRRRDLRGRQRGTVRATPHGTLLLTYEWDAPLAGRGEDEFIVSDGRLLVVSTNWVGGREIKYTQVYTRR